MELGHEEDQGAWVTTEGCRMESSLVRAQTVDRNPFKRPPRPWTPAGAASRSRRWLGRVLGRVFSHTKHHSPLLSDSTLSY